MTVVLLIILFDVVLIKTIGVIQGYGSVINHAGIVRGTSQRIVKNEILGVDSENLIKNVDEILHEMSTGYGKRGIIYIEDRQFRKELEDIIKDWGNLKKEIYNYKIIKDEKLLYMMSENFFERTNHLVFTVQRISEEKMRFLVFFKLGLIGITVIVMILLIRQSYRYIGLMENIKSLDEMAHIDKITGLPNRRSCDIQIEKYAHMKKLPNLLCISIDLNNLKYVNDTYGHFVGDRLITLFGQVLKEDVMPHGFTCRNGGDEFIVFVENSDEEKLYEIIEHIDKHIKIINKKEQIIEIDYSWGAVLSSEDESFTIYDIIELADKRMYQYKNNKKMMIFKG